MRWNKKIKKNYKIQSFITYAGIEKQIKKKLYVFDDNLKNKFWFNLFNFDGEGVQRNFFSIQKSEEDNWIEKNYKILKC